MMCRSRPDGAIIAGVGTILHRILLQLRFKRDGCGPCDAMIAKMNEWGPAGCHLHREEIIRHLRKAYQETSKTEKATAAFFAVTSGLAFKLNPLDRYGSLLDLAISHALEQDASLGP